MSSFSDVNRAAYAHARRRRAVVAGALSFAAACAWHLHSPRSPLALAVPLLALGVACISAPRRMWLPCVLACAAVAGIARAELAVPAHPLGAYAGQGVALAGVIASTDSPGDVLDVRHVATPIDQHDVNARVLLSRFGMQHVDVGDEVVVAATLHAPSRRPGARSMDSLARDDVDFIATVTSLSKGGVEESPQRWLALMRNRIAAAVDGQLPEPNAALVLGIALGIHRTLPADVRAPLQNSGLYHIVAVSGLKVIIVLAVIESVLAELGVSARRRRAAGLILVALYAAISGGGAAAVRSACMATLTFALRRDGRRLDPIVGLALLSTLMIALEPHILFDVGFQLSFVGTASIVLMAAPLQRRLPGPPLLTHPLAMTIAAQVATFPIIAATFGVISLIGPLANALALPLLPVVIALGVVGSGAAAISPLLGWLPLHLASVLVMVIVQLAQLLSALPGAAIAVERWPAALVVVEVVGGCAALGAVVLTASRRWSHERRLVVAAASGAAAALLAFGVTSLPDGQLHVTVLDVGAAPAVLLKSEAGKFALIDTGADATHLLPALGRVLPPFANDLDSVVLTSSDRHALGGLGALAGRYRVRSVVVATSLPTAAVATVETLRQAGADVVVGQNRWTWQNVAFTCVGFDSDHPTYGCALQVITSRHAAVVVDGMLPSPAQDDLAAMGRSLSAALLVAPPGGAVSQPLLDVVRPEFVAIPSASATAPRPLAGVGSVSSTGHDGDLGYTVTSDGIAADP